MATKARLKDPEGGLTPAGRRAFARREGSRLRPGVKAKTDTPEKMRRKGSFLRRHFARPRGPMRDAKGRPTRLALSAHAWGEPVPKTMADAKKLAEKGKKLLERYAKTKTRPPRKNSLVENVNRRKRAGASRPKSRSTVSKESYDRMEKGWPKRGAKRG